MIDLTKFGFIKTEKNTWVVWKDYIYDDLRSDYGYYLRASIHEPFVGKITSPDIDCYMYQIIVHRYEYDRTHIEQWLEEGESRISYHGLIPSEEFFEELLVNLGIKYAVEKE